MMKRTTRSHSKRNKSVGGRKTHPSVGGRKTHPSKTIRKTNKNTHRRTPTPSPQHTLSRTPTPTHTRTPRRRTPTSNAEGLTADEIEGLLVDAMIIEEKGDKSGRNDTEEEVNALREKLRKLRYDPEYTSCFNGARIPTFYAQAGEKLACFLNNDIEIV